MIEISSPSCCKNKQRGGKKSKAAAIMSRLMASVVTHKTAKNPSNMGKTDDELCSSQSLVKVGRCDSVATYQSIDGDTSHTGDTCFSLDEEFGFDDSSRAASPVMRKLKESKKSLRFAPTVAIRKTMSRNSYTEEEQRRCWYRKEEYDRIHAACRRILAKYESCTHKDRFKYCMRGLEHQTTVGSRSRSTNRQNASICLLDANFDTPEDAEAIAEAYGTISSSCHLWAHCVGLRDQKQAERYHDI